MTRSPASKDPTTLKNLANTFIQKAKSALRQGDRQLARKYAEQAVGLAPDLEEAWLILAAIAPPRASITYLQQALRINPSSIRVQKGMAWAQGRLTASRNSHPSEITSRSVIPANTKVYHIQPNTDSARKLLPDLLQFAFGLLFFSLLFIAASLTPYYYQYLAGTGQVRLPQFQQFAYAVQWFSPAAAGDENDAIRTVQPTDDTIQFSVLSPSATAFQVTATPFTVPTNTPTSTYIPTPLETTTQLPTDIPSPTETPTLEPTPYPLPSQIIPSSAIPPAATKKPKLKAAAGPGPRPAKVTLSDRWIDVDLSSQTTFAMQGDQIIRSFVVSTGRWPTVTIVGVYKIYVKYRRASMSGDDYYLPNVPYVMYFYQDYGLHGTYWHNEFGTPMSHGCVNMKTEDAAWLYDFASVGTFVSIHQ